MLDYADYWDPTRHYELYHTRSGIELPLKYVDHEVGIDYLDRHLFKVWIISELTYDVYDRDLSDVGNFLLTEEGVCDLPNSVRLGNIQLL